MKNKRKRLVDDDESYSENSDVYFSEEAEFDLEKELNPSRESQHVEMKSIYIPTSTPSKENDFSELSTSLTESLTIPSNTIASSSIILTVNRSPPSPLAHKQFKRRKVTEFLFSSPFYHPSPFCFQYPTPSYAIVTATASTPSNSQLSISRPNNTSLSRIGSKKLKKSTSFSEPNLSLNDDYEDPDAEFRVEEVCSIYLFISWNDFYSFRVLIFRVSSKQLKHLAEKLLEWIFLVGFATNMRTIRFIKRS